ncbi:hypothetical protein F5Y18DRAFT_443963 [Xylariaceae sp. FL1019]|nr:hypothetical protein F5Y18DRAFT_443963 [Xylariaceae sp. FL1019]
MFLSDHPTGANHIIDMTEVATIDGMWRAFAQHISVVEDRLHCLKPLNTFPAGEEPSTEDMDMLVSTADTLEILMDAMDSFDWTRDASALTSGDRNIVYASLGPVRAVLTACDSIMNPLAWLPIEHASSTREDGAFPSDLAPSLVEQLSLLIPRLERAVCSYHSRLQRKIYNLGVRPLSILDLPNETLMHVFAMTKFAHSTAPGQAKPLYHDHAEPEHRDAIKNARLTCRRFCMVSSHDFITCVQVRVNTKSLARFQAIAQHPTFQKSIQKVTINTMSSYGAHQILDFDEFVSYCTWDLDDRTGLDETFDNNGRRILLSFTPQDEKVKNLIETWEKIANGTCIKRGKNMAALEQAYDEYCQHLKDQQQMIESGMFANAVQIALSQMPRIQVLFIGIRCSYNRLYDYAFIELNADYPLTIARMFVDSVLKDGCYNVKCTFDVLSSLQSIGCHPKTLHIHLGDRIKVSSMSDLPALESFPLCSITERLRYISVRVPVCPQLWFTDTQRRLSVLLSIKGLRGIRLDFDENSRYTSPPSPLTNNTFIGPMLNGQDLSTLEWLVLRYAPIHEHELQRLISSSAPRSSRGEVNAGIMLGLGRIQLLSGSWANIIDSFRTKANSKSWILDPKGGEFDGMSAHHHRSVQNDVHRFVAEGWTGIDNPIRSALEKIASGTY